MIFRAAEKNDALAIANLHAESWRNTYRGLMSDAYLDNEVGKKRLVIWQERLANPDEHQHIILAIKADTFMGF